jgi:hypothetical protein
VNAYVPAEDEQTLDVRNAGRHYVVVSHGYGEVLRV